MKHLSAILISVLLLAGCASTPKPKGDPVNRDMLVTGYCKCGKCTNWKHTMFLRRTVVKDGANEGKKKDVGQTASGKKAKVGTIAADTSKYPMGTVMYIPGYGYGTVEDRGGAIKGDHIDLYFKSHKAALKWGKQQKQVQVWLK